MTGLAPAVVDRLTRLGRIRTLRRGERLIHEGSQVDAVILVIEGTLRVTRLLGGTEVVIAIRGPGDLLGELGPITQGTAGASVEARDAGRVLVIASSRFVAAQRADPEVASAVVQRLVASLGESDRRLANAQCKPLPSRVAEEILNLEDLDETASRDPGAGVAVTQAELASLCVTSRSTAAEAVGVLRSRGVITTRRGHVIITDRDGLQEIAEHDYNAE